MAKIEIITTSEEQQIVLNAVKNLEGTVIPVSTIVKEAGLPDSRVRYALVDLIEAGKIRRIPTRAFNKHYVRYSYEVLKEEK